MNAILDQCSKSSPEEQEETPASKVPSKDHKTKSLLSIITMEFEKFDHKWALN